MTSLHYLYGKPEVRAAVRTNNGDFMVKEVLPFAPTGEGEHHLLRIRKDGLNTVDVARKLADFAGVHPKEVTFAGQKDKHAICEQWFGVRIPGKLTPAWAGLNGDRLQVLSSDRHGKKLRLGALSENQFTLTLRDISDIDQLVDRIHQVQQHGVPNYFGEQRFGRHGKNLILGRQMLAGRKVKDRNKRSMYLSAVRSNLFNQMVSARLAAHTLSPLEGDCVLLAGSNSYFVATDWDDTLLARLQEKDIQLSAPLWGQGQALAKAQALEFETSVAMSLEQDCHGLEQAGLSQKRRRLTVEPRQFHHKVDGDTLVLTFALPAGCFATSLLRELVDYEGIKQPLSGTINKTENDKKND